MLRSLAWMGCSLLALSSSSGAQEPNNEARLSVEQFATAVRERLASHKYFSKILLVEDHSAAPVILWLHQPQVAAPDWQNKLAANHAPFLQKLHDEFQRLLVVPCKLERRDDTPANVVCVLQTAGDYSNYAEAVTARGYYGGAAYFERRSRWTVSYDQGGKPSRSDRRNALCGEFVRALFQAHFTGLGGEPMQEWFVEGLAGYMVDGLGADAASLAVRAPLEHHVKLLADLARDPAQTRKYLRPISAWAREPRFDRYSTHVANAPDSAAAKPDGTKTFRAYHAQATLWTHFLFDANEGRSRDRLRRVLADIARGDGGEKSFQKAFEGMSLDDLDREFYRWVFEHHARFKPAEKIDPKLAETLFATSSAPLAAAGGATTSFDPKSLLVREDDFVALHGLALRMVLEGRYEQALTVLKAHVERARGGAHAGALEREIARIDGLVRARDEFVAEVIASGEKRSFEFQGKKVIARFEALDGDTVVLGENRQKLERLPLVEISPAWLAREFPKSFADTWVRAYAQILVGDERWKRASGDLPALVELKADAAALFSDAFEQGAGAQALAELVEFGLPVDAFGAGECFDRLAKLLERFGSTRVVTEKREQLARYADVVLNSNFGPDVLSKGFPGKFEVLVDGRVRWTLAFDDAVEARMFVNEPRGHAAYRANLPVLGRGAGLSTCEVQRGSLMLQGESALVLPLSFAAPLTVQYSTRIMDAASSNYASVVVFACEAGDNSFVGANERGGLVASDSAAHHYQIDWESPGYVEKRAYAINASLRDGRFKVSVDGMETGDISAGPCQRGRIVLFVHSDPAIEMLELMIEGAVDLEAARPHWMRARKAALGL